MKTTIKIFCFEIVFFIFIMNNSFFVFPGLSHASGLAHAPEKNPPKIDLNLPDAHLRRVIQSDAPPGIEWVFHKTADGLHPDGNEQQMLWLMNRARSNPAREGIWLAEMDDPDTVSSRSYFNVNIEVLKNEFAGYDTKPPAAFDVRLYNAAKAHSDDLIVRDSQDHNNQFLRVDDAGFKYSSGAGNVYSYAYSALYAHAGFNIDWGGDDGTGMQAGRGHRTAMMSITGDYSNVGFAAVPESDPSSQVGPLVVTQNFCKAREVADHYNRFILGTVWEDKNGNNMYDPDEGIDGITIMPDHGDYYAITSKSGGYAIPIAASGIYRITFSGVALFSDFVKIATIGEESILLDFIKGQGNSAFVIQDYFAVLKILAGFDLSEELSHLNPDFDGNGIIEMKDALGILEITGGTRSENIISQGLLEK